MTEEGTGAAPGRGPREGQAWLGYCVAGICLIWVFYDVRLGDLWGHLLRLRWGFLVMAIGADIASYTVQGARWSQLLRPFTRLGGLKATQAIYAGLFTNEVLPMRLGEILRVYLVSGWTSLKMSTVFSSLLVERFCDAIWLSIAVGVVVLTVPLPGYLVEAEAILSTVTFAAILLFVYLAYRHRPGPGAGGDSERGRARFRRLLDDLSVSLGLMGRSRHFLFAFGWSSLVLILQILAYWLVMLAYRIELSFWQATAVVLIVHLGTLVPGAPSNLGTYQFFTVVGLTLFGVEKTQASGFSVVVFLVLTMPLWAIGTIAFARCGLTLERVRSTLGRLRQKRVAETPGTREP